MIREFPAPLLFDVPPAEPARTRRSSRTSSAPVPAPSEAAVPPIVVEASIAVAAIIVTDAMTDAAAPTPVPVLTRRAARAAAAAVPVEPVRVAAEPFELLEPVAAPEAESVVETEEVLSEPVAAPAASGVDAFEEAARLFSFTGENPVMAAPAEDAASVTEDIAVHVAARGRRPRRGLVAFKRVAATSFSIGVMGVVGLLTVGLTTPAEAVAAVPAGSSAATVSVRAPLVEASEKVDAEIQAYVAPSSAENDDLSRHESYSTVTMAQIAAESGIKNVSNFFVNDQTAAIQWPFAVGVPITYGFGMRSGSMHNGADFVPGEGAPIQAIADGVVRVASNSGGGYGVHVIIDHVIDGQRVSSHYAHMIYDSIEVTEGQQVTVGTVLGHTGNTGRSFGAHTHFEILMNGTTPIDPIPWLREHAGG